MKNKFEKDFFESRDTWWAIQEQVEKLSEENIAQELKHIIELSLYNQRDMLIEIDRLNTEIVVQKKPQIQEIIKEPKKREVRFLDNHFLEKIDKFLYKMKI